MVGPMGGHRGLSRAVPHLVLVPVQADSRAACSARVRRRISTHVERQEGERTGGAAERGGQQPDWRAGHQRQRQQRQCRQMRHLVQRQRCGRGQRRRRGRTPSLHARAVHRTEEGQHALQHTEQRAHQPAADCGQQSQRAPRHRIVGTRDELERGTRQRQPGGDPADPGSTARCAPGRGACRRPADAASRARAAPARSRPMRGRARAVRCRPMAGMRRRPAAARRPERPCRHAATSSRRAPAPARTSATGWRTGPAPADPSRRARPP